MDAIREKIRDSWVFLAIALAIGLGLGLFYAWMVNPLVLEDTTPEMMRADLQADYLRMAIESYSVNRNVDKAVERYQALGENADEALAQVGADPEEVDPTAIQNFSAVVEIMEESEGEGAESAPSEGEGEGAEAEIPGEEATEERPAGSAAMRLILPVCGATFVLGLLLVAVLILRNRLGEEGEEEPVLEPGFDMPGEFEMDYEEPAFPEGFETEEPFGGAGETAATEPEETVEQDATLGTFRTIYTLGDDRYDDSFSIESAAGDFLGECGVGIGEVMGAGEPKKVSAFEVWLFDKNDIQTVTQVLLSEYAYRDEETRARLSAKGEPILAEAGGVLYLETASLEIEARIVDMIYGQSALPDESFFERMTIELKARPRGA